MSETATATAEALRYRSHPLRDDYPRSVALVAIVAGISVAVGVSFEAAGWAAFSALVLGISLARYFAPTDYTLDGEGVRARFLGRERRRPWSEVRGVYPHRDGVHLSPFARPSPLDPFRGIYLRFAGNRDAVLAICERHVRRA
jgi:hypothetical protein